MKKYFAEVKKIEWCEALDKTTVYYASGCKRTFKNCNPQSKAVKKFLKNSIANDSYRIHQDIVFDGVVYEFY